MSSIATVRVANPAVAGGYMTINVSDLRERHTLWHDQAEGFEVPKPLQAKLDPALRDAAAALALRMIAFKCRAEDEPFAEMATVDQLTVIARFAGDLDKAEAEYAEHVAGLAPREPNQSPTPVVLKDIPAVIDAPFAVAKGPRGLWYVTQGERRVSKGFLTEADADAERGRMVAA